MPDEGPPRWLDPRIWFSVLALGLLGIATGLVWDAWSQKSGSFSGFPTHRTPTNRYLLDSTEKFQPPIPPGGEPQTAFQTAGKIRKSETRTVRFPMDAAGDAMLCVAFPDGDLDLEIVSPSGQSYGPARKSEKGFGYEESKEGFLGLGPGRTDYVFLDKIEAGMWTARVTAKAVPDTMPEVPYLFAVLVTGAGVGATLQAVSYERTFHLGEPAVLSASVREGGKPVTDADVSAILLAPDGTRSNVPLADDGHAPDSTARDGKYAGLTSKLHLAGNYDFLITASRAIAPGRTGFERKDGGMFVVSRSRSHWTGRFRDFGRDTTRNGQFDELVVEAELEVTDSCRLSGIGTLVDRKGGAHRVSFFHLEVGPGRRVVPLSFDGEEIFQSGEAGPYELTQLRLSEEDSLGWIAALDELRPSYRTKAYGLYDFQRDPNRILGVRSAKGIDPDQNGKFQALAVDVEIELDLPSHMQWDAWLEVGGGSGAVHSTSTATLPKGRQTVRVLFPGGCVHKMGGDGRFRLRGFILYGQHMYGPERDLEMPPVVPEQFDGPDEIRAPDGRSWSSCEVTHR